MIYHTSEIQRILNDTETTNWTKNRQIVDLCRDLGMNVHPCSLDPLGVYYNGTYMNPYKISQKIRLITGENRNFKGLKKSDQSLKSRYPRT